MIVKLLSYNIALEDETRESIGRSYSLSAPDLVVFQEAIDPEVISRLAVATDFLSGRPANTQSDTSAASK